MARRIKLTTMADVSKEHASIYRLARSGELDLADARTFSMILTNQKNIIEQGSFEARLDDLERLLTARNITPMAKRIS